MEAPGNSGFRKPNAIGITDSTYVCPQTQSSSQDLTAMPSKHRNNLLKMTNDFSLPVARAILGSSPGNQQQSRLELSTYIPAVGQTTSLEVRPDHAALNSRINGPKVSSTGPTNGASFQAFIQYVIQHASKPAVPPASASSPTIDTSSEDRPGSTLFASGLPLDTFIKHTLLNAFPKQHTSLELYTGEPGLEATKVPSATCAGTAPRIPVNGLQTQHEDEFSQLFKRIGNAEDVDRLSDDDLFGVCRFIVGSLPPQSPFSAKFMAIQADRLISLFKRSASIEHLNEAIALYQQALQLCPRNNSERPRIVQSLTLSLELRLTLTDSTVDLDDVIRLRREGLESFPIWDPQRLFPLGLMSNCLVRRITTTGDTRDFLELARLQVDTLRLVAPNHPLHPIYLQNFAASVARLTSTEWESSHSGVDLTNTEIINLCREALGYYDVTHSRRISVLVCLATRLLHQNRYSEKGGDCLEAMGLLREAKALAGDGHDEMMAISSNLATSLFREFGTTGNEDYLSEALDLQRDMLTKCPQELRPRALSNLSYGLQQRFERRGSMEDLIEAIGFSREAYKLSSHPSPTIIAHLAACLCRRYRLTRDVNDLLESTSLWRDALKLRPDDSVILCQLASCLADENSETGSSDNLAEIIDLYQKALLTSPEDSLERFRIQSNVASVLSSDVDNPQTLQLRRDALKLLPEGHPGRPKMLVYVANILAQMHCPLKPGSRSIWAQFQRNPDCFPGDRMCSFSDMKEFQEPQEARPQESEELVEAVKCYSEALRLCPNGHPDRAEILVVWGGFLTYRFLTSFDYLDPVIIWSWGCLDEERLRQVTTSSHEITAEAVIIAMLKMASSAENAPIDMRMKAAFGWTHLATMCQHESQLDAASTIVSLLELAVARAASVDEQYRGFGGSEMDGIARDAAATATRYDDLMGAVTLLEQGRALILKQLGQHRADMDKIRGVAPELAERFHRLGKELNELTVRGSQAEMFEATAFGYRDSRTSYHKVSMEWNAALREIREIEGFESFLRPPQYSELRQAAVGGPVIVINVALVQSDAIIVLPHSDPILVSLPMAKLEVIQTLVARMGLQPAALADEDMVRILRELWKILVQPIVERLQSPVVGLCPGSRIWWCPAGPASELPLHAAGPYAEGERNLSQIFISSYTPTLGALIRAREAQVPVARAGRPSLLIVSQPETPGEDPLRSAADERRFIQKHAHGTAMVMEGTSGTCNAVIDGLMTQSWLHLACHGHHDPLRPFLSHFSLHDGPLSLRAIIQHELPHADLAYLSACHSAKVNEGHPDEMLHLAAGMMFAGYKSVVGTMWALDDDTGSIMANEFYRMMLGSGRGPKTSDKAAVALVKSLERLPDWVPLTQRINFVHFGI